MFIKKKIFVLIVNILFLKYQPPGQRICDTHSTETDTDEEPETTRQFTLLHNDSM